jgi:hypothetical protein
MSVDPKIKAQTIRERWDPISKRLVPVNLQCPVPPVVTTDSVSSDFSGNNYANCTLVSAGSALTDRGIVWNSYYINPVPPVYGVDNVVSVGPGVGSYECTYNQVGATAVRAYAIGAVGIVYGATLYSYANVCLASGTLITLEDGSTKRIDDVEYTDLLAVWNFDEGTPSSAYPLWIKRRETSSCYNLLTFSDGTELRTIGQHRVFCVEQGKFAHPVDMPIGTHTFTHFGDFVRLVSKKVVYEPIDHFNVLTEFHINSFANGILTSCRYNNVYPIRDMQFVKDLRPDVIHEEFDSIPDKYYIGLRLFEQIIPIQDTLDYVMIREFIAKV